MRFFRPPSDIDQHPRHWRSCPLSQRSSNLPHAPGLYAALRGRRMLYIGKSEDLRDRWQGRGHHRYEQLRRIGRCRLHWCELPERDIHAKETELIQRWKPQLNNTPVPVYRRSWPQRLAAVPWLTGAMLALFAAVTLFPNQSLRFAQQLLEVMHIEVTDD